MAKQQADSNNPHGSGHAFANFAYSDARDENHGHTVSDT
jgi:hypothetical protein